MFTGHYEQYDDATEIDASIPAVGTPENQYTYFLKVEVKEGGICQFSYGLDGQSFQPPGEVFQAAKSVWIGANIGFSA